MVDVIDVRLEDGITNNMPTHATEAEWNQSEIIFHDFCRRLVIAFELFLEKKVEELKEVDDEEKKKIGIGQGVDLFNSFWRLQQKEMKDLFFKDSKRKPFLKLEVLGFFCYQIKKRKWSHSIEKEKLRVGNELSANMGQFFLEIIFPSKSSEQLNSLKEQILKFREVMKEVNEYWKENISHFEKSGDFSIYRDFASVRDSCKIIRNQQSGASGSYLMINPEGEPLFVIKPMDEDIGGINNPIWSSLALLAKEDIKERISNYRLPRIDMMAHLIAKIAGIEAATPEAVMMLVKDAQFYDFVGSLSDEEKVLLDKELLYVENEKLCSVQRFIPDAKNWYSAIQSLQQEGLTDEEIKKRIDQEDFENANVLMWLTNEEDGHGGNLLGYVKKYNQEGNPIWGIKKIDNGLCLGESNGNFSNALVYLPNSQEPLSEKGKEIIRHLDEITIIEKMGVLELEKSIEAFQDRVRLLKEWVEEEGITIHTINDRLQKVEKDYEKSI